MSSSYQQESSQQAFRWHYAEFDDSNFQIRGRTLFFMVVLFSVILLFTLLFLYARWVCRIGPPPPPPASNSVRAPPPPPQLRGLDLATINSFPVVLYRNQASSGAGGESSELECCICLGIFGDGDKVKVLPMCDHWFHVECVDKWLAARSSCPLCRSSLRVDSPA